METSMTAKIGVSLSDQSAFSSLPSCSHGNGKR